MQCPHGEPGSVMHGHGARSETTAGLFRFQKVVQKRPEKLDNYTHLLIRNGQFVPEPGDGITITMRRGWTHPASQSKGKRIIVRCASAGATKSESIQWRRFCKTHPSIRPGRKCPFRHPRICFDRFPVFHLRLASDLGPAGDL